MNEDSAYYQLALPTNGIEELDDSIRREGIDSIRLNSADKILFALKVSPDTLPNFDQKTRRLKLRYLMLKNIDFHHILQNAGEFNLIIRKIRTESIEDDEVARELEEAIEERNYNRCSEIIQNNNIIIKSIESRLNRIHTIFYESGMIWSERDILPRNRIIQFMESIFG